MPLLSTYELDDLLSESTNSVVYRAHQPGDPRSFVLTLLPDLFPTPDQLSRFKREYELCASLAVPQVVRSLALEYAQQRWFMVFEDIGGESLARLRLAGHLSIPAFLDLAIQITAALQQLHRQHIIHKDLNPSNIIFNPTSAVLQLIDFGLATRIARHETGLRAPDRLDGTLAYLAPEQTGRMNRQLDYRSDFYSLGATFYELLTGRPPFQAANALELVHCHLALAPQPPHELNPRIPPVLSAMLLKLLAKNADERYQSSAGLLVDLEECRRQWQAGSAMASFPIGEHDRAEQLQLPQKLYG